MRIQHNIMAMNAYRNYNNNTSALSKNLEKLSSGYRINRAGDDAAGLAISEKMRAQISGLEQAGNNVKDGISLVQTGEGALQEVQDMLNRMVTLAEESANGTYQDDVDRENLQSELTALTDEINRIADSSNFNGIKLLDGSLGGTAKITDVAAKAATAAQVTVDMSNIVGNGATDIKVGGVTVVAGAAATGSMTAGAIVAAITKTTISIGGANYNLTTNGTDVILTATAAGATTLTATNFVGTGATGSGTSTAAVVDGKAPTNAGTEIDYSNATAADVLGTTVTVAGTKYQFLTANGTADTGCTAVTITDADTGAAIASALAGVITGPTVSDDGAGVVTITATNAGDDVSVSQTGGGLTLQIGDTSESFNQMSVAIKDMHASAMKIDTISVKNQSDAASAISVIKDAINYVSSTRGDLGAIQNRLEHTSNNLSVMTENIQDAESTIRDTDIAEEMMSYTKNNILVQSAQAMLAQANTVPQGVLQLLQ